MCPLCRQKTEQDSTIVNVQIDKNDDELVSNSIYCEVGSTKRYSKRTPDADVELEENLAYGHFETASDSYEDNIP